MIDLNKKVVGEVQEAPGWDPIPEGEYVLELTKFGDWEMRKKNGIDFAMANIELTVKGGEYNGRVIKSNLLEHPKTPWAVPSFIAGFKGSGQEFSLNDLKTFVGETAVAYVGISSYEGTKKVKDELTGAEIEKPHTYTNNEVKRWEEKPVIGDPFANIFPQ